ncbi:MAG: hypothetical protein U0002_00695 [Thermoanaerobaculia bacterium]
MRSILDPASEAEVRARVAKLTATAPARWGKMSAQEMICHLTDGLRVALGEVEVTVRKNFLRHRPLRWLFVYTSPGQRASCRPQESSSKPVPVDGSKTSKP